MKLHYFCTARAHELVTDEVLRCGEPDICPTLGCTSELRFDATATFSALPAPVLYAALRRLANAVQSEAEGEPKTVNAFGVPAITLPTPWTDEAAAKMQAAARGAWAARPRPTLIPKETGVLYTPGYDWLLDCTDQAITEHHQHSNHGRSVLESVHTLDLSCLRHIVEIVRSKVDTAENAPPFPLAARMNQVEQAVRGLATSDASECEHDS